MKLKNIRLIIIPMVLFSLPMTGCASQAPESEKVVAREPAENKVELPVPQTIKDQLLTPDDVSRGAKLNAEVIPTSKGPVRLLISGGGSYSCSPTGNCDRWIFRQTGSGYEMEADLGSAQIVRFKKSTESEFPDLEAQQHGSATFSELRLFQSDGSRYRLIKCMKQDFQDPSDPDLTLEKPIITEIPCDPEEERK